MYKGMTQEIFVNLYLAGALAPLLVDVHDVVESVGVEVADRVFVGHDQRRVVPQRLAVVLLGELIPLCAEALGHEGHIRCLGPGFQSSARLNFGPGSRVSGALDLAELRADTELAGRVVLAVSLVAVVEALVDAVAEKAPIDALGVVAAELAGVRAAVVDGGAGRRDLVGAVGAILKREGNILIRAGTITITKES